MSAPAPTPRVAAIVPAYGVAHLLSDALRSLQAQTMADWECVVVDDGAPDDVASVVAPFLSDRRITFLATDNGGVSTARNRAIAASTAPLVTLLDGDDLLRPAYFERVSAALTADDSIRFVTCNARIFGAVSKERHCFVDTPTKRGSLDDVLDRSFGVYIGSTFRRADFDAIGGFDPAMAHAEDLDLWVRLMMLGGEALYLDEVLGDYRVRPGSASASDEKMMLGNIRVYEKAIAAEPGTQTVALCEAMIADNRRQLAMRHAIDRVIDGDTKTGLAELSRHYGEDNLRWRVSLALWRVFPWLSRPMLTWRRMAHARGSAVSFAGFLHRMTRPAERGR